jgi:hypothetical protein
LRSDAPGADAFNAKLYRLAKRGHAFAQKGLPYLAEKTHDWTSVDLDVIRKLRADVASGEPLHRPGRDDVVSSIRISSFEGDRVIPSPLPEGETPPAGVYINAEGSFLPSKGRDVPQAASSIDPSSEKRRVDGSRRRSTRSMRGYRSEASVPRDRMPGQAGQLQDPIPRATLPLTPPRPSFRPNPSAAANARQRDRLGRDALELPRRMPDPTTSRNETPAKDDTHDKFADSVRPNGVAALPDMPRPLEKSESELRDLPGFPGDNDSLPF